MGYHDVGSSVDRFINLPVESFDPKVGLRDVADHAYRIAINWDEYDGNEDAFRQKLQSLVQDAGLASLQALIVGLWSPESGESAGEIIRTLTENASRLGSLRGLFFGDISSEEQEISWIENGDQGPLITQLASLEDCVVRGGEGLRFTGLRSHKLKRLVVQTGGLGSEAIQDIIAAELPELTHLELYLGDGGYGWDGDVETLRPLLERGRHPKLEYLGLRNAEITDDICEALRGSTLIEQLSTLDLSSGTLTDRGGEALLGNPAIAHLDELDLHHHYLSSEMAARLTEAGKNLGVRVNVEDQQEADDDDGEPYRYVEISE